MSYQSLIKKQVRSAFRLAGDLIVDVTLIKKANNGFDFSTLEATKDSTDTKVIKALLKTRSKEPKGETTNTTTSFLVINSDDVDENIIYATALIRGVLWNLVIPYKNNGFTTEIELSKEA